MPIAEAEFGKCVLPSYSIYLVNTWYVPGTVLGTRDTSINKANLPIFVTLGEDRHKQQTQF